MDAFLETLATVGGIVTVIGVVVGSIVLARGSYNRARIEALRGDNGDLRARIDDLEDAVERHALKEKSWEEERKHMLAENATLMLAATQSAEVDVLKSQLQSHHDQNMSALGDIRAVLERIAGET